MASDKNNPQKGQGSNKPDPQKSSGNDAADVDWMIMSDLSTRIGGSPQPKPASNQLSGNSSSQLLNNQANENDLEDIEWLRSLGLDEEIERSPSTKKTSSSQGSNNTETKKNDVENIDWLIMTDLKTRIDDSEIKAKDKSISPQISQSQTTLQPSSQSNNLPTDDLDLNDLDLNNLDFLGNSDFADLDSLNFDTSDSFDLGLQDLQIGIENNENIQDLDEFFNDNFDSSNALNDDNWDNILGKSSVETNDQVGNTQPSLNITNESFDIPTQISGFVRDDEEYSESINLNTDQLAEPIYQDDLLEDLEKGLGNDWDLLDEVQADVLVADTLEDALVADVDTSSIFLDELQDIPDLAPSLEDDLPLSEYEQVEIVAEASDNLLLDDGFGEVRSLEISNSVEMGDEIWSSTVPNLESPLTDESIDSAFASNWIQAGDQAIDDSIWHSSSSIDSPSESSPAIDNAFGSLDDWENIPEAENLEIEENISLNISSPENIEQAFDADFGLASEQDSEQKFEQTFDDQLDHQVPSEDVINDDWSADLEAEISHGNDAVDWNVPTIVTTEVEHELPDTFSTDEFVPSDAYISSNIDASVQHDEYNQAKSEVEPNEIKKPDDSMDLSSGWSNLSESIADQITESSFIDEFDNYADDLSNNVVVPVSTSLQNPNWNAEIAESVTNGNDHKLDSMLNEDFDLATFDEDSLLEEPLGNFNNVSMPTTLTPIRVAPIPSPEEQFTSGVVPNPPFDALNSSTDNLISETDFLQEAMAHDLLNESYEEMDEYQEAADKDLLNSYGTNSGGLDNFVSPQQISPPPVNFVPPVNIGKSVTNVGIDSSDFLDEFDLDSMDSQLTGDDFGSGFVSPTISTGLVPPAPPIAPLPPVPPIATRQEPTAPSVSSPPPPPPFLPPLPPKRIPNQSNTAPLPPPPSIDSQPQTQNTMGRRGREDDFDRFHAQPDPHKNRKSINTIDDSWSELLDAETVLSGGLRSSDTGSMGSTATPIAGASGRPSQGKAANSSRGSSGSRRKEIDLPDFNDLGIEIHADGNDWSGLLDNSDLSDSITTISKQSTQLPSRGRSNPPSSARFDSTGTSETKEIPRDRRKPMPSFNEPTQASMGMPRDQMDFNRFTEDNYESYEEFQQSITEAELPPKKPPIKMPSISLESLWQDYLKIPVIGLAAIGGAFTLYSLLNRPVFDIGLRWGIFKDASGKDFTNADFKGAKLDNVDFSKATLTGAKMQDASLVGANFQDANLDGVNFTNANLSKARLIRASVIWAEFNKAQMIFVDLAESNLTLSNFVGAKMEGVNLKGSKIGAQGTDKATKFNSTTLLAWQIVNDMREGRNLANQDLSGLNLSFTSLKRANLSNTRLNYTDMTGTDLSGANLSGSQINGANWSGAKLNGINLSGVIFEPSKLPKTDEETICPNAKKGPCKF